MALLYSSTLIPTKLELLTGWLPAQPWFEGEPGAELANVSAFRFDDPDGEVGVETILLRAGDGPILQVPLTYRAAPLEGAERWLVGTTQHSVLGKRFVYDAVGDPVYLATLATAVLTGGRQADEFLQTENGVIERVPKARVVGTGSDAVGFIADDFGATSVRLVDGKTVIEADALTISIARVPAVGEVDAAARPSLSATWLDQSALTTLATVERVS